MRYLILLSILVILAHHSKSQTPLNDPHWQLIWQDEFNSLNTSIWHVANNFDHYGGELQVYTNRTDNVEVQNGNLILRVKNETYSCPPWALADWHCARQYQTGLPYNYTSGLVETKQAYNLQYGYIESRIKVPFGRGFWPAFWTFIADGLPTSSNMAEIDIFEMLGSNGQTYNVGTNIHLDYCQNPDPFGCNNQLYQQKCPLENPNILCYGLDLLLANFNYSDWHTYAIEWNPSKIIWYIDNTIVRSFPNPGVVDPIKIILNLAVEPWTPPNHTTPFPSEMLVDYIRVYKLNNDCNTNMNVCNYNFSIHDNKIKKNITIGNNTCTNTIHSGQNVYLRASEGVVINGDFTVVSGSQLYIDVNACYE